MKFFSFFDSLMENVGIWLILFMTSIIFFQVIARYGFNYAFSWPEEIARYLFIWTSYIGIAMVMGRNLHLRVTIIHNYISKRMQKCVDIFCMIINMIFFSISTYLGFSITMDIMDMEQMSVSIPIPVWIVWAGIPICFILTALQTIRVILNIVHELKTGEKGVL